MEKVWSTLAAAGSGALLLGALAFEYIGGLAPCHLCMFQRYPHVVALVIGALVWVLPKRWLIALGALAPAASAAVGIFHAGVERKWWEGPSSCTGSGNALSGMSGADLLSTDAPVHLVMCDQVAWSMLGLSMASWNAIASLLLVALWIKAWRSAKPRVFL
ncbi:disulfide bond formation protein B [Falsirhodobacter sp. 1013]|uniref:disulfide bond formation protein B n=1 Tax=Falsirhodobacter sp. 1013 TaxID=3417566 RepID=UPI003EBBF42A